MQLRIPFVRDMTLYHWVPDPDVSRQRGGLIFKDRNVKENVRTIIQRRSIESQNNRTHISMTGGPSSARYAATEHVSLTDLMLQTSVPLGLTDPGATFVTSSPTGSRTYSSTAPVEVTDL